MLQYLIMLGLVVLLVVRELSHSGPSAVTPEPVVRAPGRAALSGDAGLLPLGPELSRNLVFSCSFGRSSPSFGRFGRHQ